MGTNNRFADGIITEIKERRLTPKPRWGFRFREAAVWVSIAACAVIGSVATTTVLFLLAGTDWDIFERLDRSFAGHVLLSLPYVWLALMATAMVGVILTVRRTRHGYRFRSAALVAAGVGVIVIAGLAFNFLGFDNEAHDFLQQQSPVYVKLVPDTDDIWNRPGNGLLAGEIERLDDGRGFVLKDNRGREWAVSAEPRQTVWRPGAATAVGTRVKLTGTAGDDLNFEAETVRPWGRQ